jgi:YgiT-type zinc finger domain-containing protein
LKEDVCERCGGKIKEGKATVERWYMGVLAVIIKDVPAGICQFCGERYYEASIVDKLNIITFDIIDKENELTEVSFDTYEKEKESP